MRQKQDRILVTFGATSEAMATEKACHEEGLPGRLIPIPREISAGCGFVWCAPPKQEEPIRELMEQRKIEYEKILRMMV